MNIGIIVLNYVMLYRLTKTNLIRNGLVSHLKAKIPYITSSCLFASYTPRCRFVLSHFNYVFVCLSVCVCVCSALTFECLDLETSFLACRYIFIISRSSSYMKVIGSRSRSKDGKYQNFC